MIRTLARAMAAVAGLCLAGGTGTARWSSAEAQVETSAPARGGTELSPAQRRRPQERQADLMRAFDIDRNGTLNLAEAKSAAAKRYDDLDPDLDDAMTRREARRRPLAAAVFQEADTDSNGVVNKAEWLALVERRFQAADADRGGALSGAELRSERGKAVARFFR